jgi:hypothetical protein
MFVSESFEQNSSMSKVRMILNYFFIKNSRSHSIIQLCFLFISYFENLKYLSS